MRIGSFAWLAMALAAAPVGARQTAVCNPFPTSGIHVKVTDEQTAHELARAPADRAIAARLYEPVRASPLILSPVGSFPGAYWVFLSYEESQDLGEILEATVSDPVFGPRIVMAYEAPRPVFMGCGWPGMEPPPRTVTVTEFRRSDTYVLALSEQEAVALRNDRGGWQSTGESFEVLPNHEFAHPCQAAARVYRFRLDHGDARFLSASPEECGLLRSAALGWTYMDVAFRGARVAADGTCPRFAPRPVYRLYNNRWAEGASSHRYVVRPELYRSMIDVGWVGEGIAFCVPAQ